MDASCVRVPVIDEGALLALPDFGIECSDNREVRAVLAEHHGVGEERSARIAVSRSPGDTFSPVEVTMMSLIRPVMIDAAVLDPRLIAGVQPAVRLLDAAGVVRPVPIADHHVRAPDQKLLIVAELDLHAGERAPDRPFVVVVGRVDRTTGDNSVIP